MLDLISIGGNLGSIRRAFSRLGKECRPVTKGADLKGERPIVLPGVGAFGAVMEALRLAGLSDRLADAVRGGTPFLGICVGHQALFDESQESPGVKGLGLIPGRIVRFQTGKVPQIGWNKIEPLSDEGWEAGYVYFVNSYYAVPRDETVVLYEAQYGTKFCAAVRTKNITAFQFHPEKSAAFGLSLLRRWTNAY